jgi:CubicO group peptidase (beta-lactamase class C family)
MNSLFLLIMSGMLASASAFGSDYDTPTPLVTSIKKACQNRVDGALLQGVAIASIDASSENLILCGDAASNHDVYELGSISKSFTGIALAKFAVENRVNLDHPIAEYIPELLGTDMGKVTSRQLATHTAGLIRDFAGTEQPWLYTEKGLITFLKAFKPNHYPAGSRNYSNVGFGTIALVLSRISGKNFQALIQSEILDPLKMNETAFNTETVPPKNLVDGHDVLLNVSQVMQLSDLATAAGGVTSDLHDMMIYLRNNLHPDTSFLGQAITLSHDQGLGWDSLPGKLPTWKDGAMSDGFSTIIEFNPKKNIGVVVLGNVFNVSSIETLGNIAMTATDAYQVIKLNPDFLNSATGQYFSDDNKTEIDISPFRQSFLQARLSQGNNAESVRLLSLADPLRFIIDDGLNATDQLSFSVDPQTQAVMVTYFGYQKTDSSGKPVYRNVTFHKKQ